MSEIADLQHKFSEDVAILILWIIKQGYQVALGEAWRSPEQAKLDAKKGKGIARSLHIDRLAIDLLLSKDGVYLTDSADYRSAGEFWEGIDNEHAWGGRFSVPDGNHFSIAYQGRK